MISSLRQFHLSPNYAFKIRRTEYIPNGTQIPSALSFSKEIPIADPINPQDVWSSSQNVYPWNEINVKMDQRLRDYLMSKEVEALKQSIPGKNATISEEMAFLKRLSKSTNDQFDRVGLSRARQQEIMEQDGFDVFMQKGKQYLKDFPKLETESKQQYEQRLEQDFQSGKMPSYRESRLLGENMTRGTGFCSQRALLNKLTIDSFNRPDLITITYKTGMVTPRLAHAWNTIIFSSGRKYVLDSAQNLHVLVSQKVYGLKIKYPHQHKIPISINHRLKKNPFSQPPSTQKLYKEHFMFSQKKQNEEDEKKYKPDAYLQYIPSGLNHEFKKTSFSQP